MCTWSWTIIFAKYSQLKSLSKDSDNFEEDFYSAESLQKLFKKLGNQASHPMEAIFLSANRGNWNFKSWDVELVYLNFLQLIPPYIKV